MKKQLLLLVMLTNILLAQAQISSKQNIKWGTSLPRLTQIPAKLSNCGPYYGPAIKMK